MIALCSRIPRSGMLSFLLLTLVMLAACGAPAFRSESELWAPSPEVLERVRPYLAEWATTTFSSPNSYEKPVEMLVLQEELGIIFLTTYDLPQPNVLIQLDEWGEWSRGYVYVHPDIDLSETYRERNAQNRHFELRKVEEHIYLYNYYN